MKHSLTSAISCRFEEDQERDIKFYAKKNGHKPAPFLRVMTKEMLELCRLNGGILPHHTQLQFMMPVVVQRKNK